MPKKNTIKKNALTPTVLISGGAGFIGSHLAEALLNNKARVVVVDDFRTGKEIHVKHLLKNEDFALYDVDINQGLPKEIESVDYIFHLAGLEEYYYSKDFLNLDSLLTNSLGTKNLLDLAERSNAKFLLVSTVDVYQGRMSQLELSRYFGETSSNQNKFSLAEAKRYAEALTWEYFKKYDADVRIARLPEVYGPHMDLSSSGALGGFVQNILDSKDLVIYGDGIEKEYYLHVFDVVSGLIKCLFTESTKGKIYSLVEEKPITILELAYLIRSLADGEVSIAYRDWKEAISLVELDPDTYNLRSLKWAPKISLRDGIGTVLESFGYKPNSNTFKPAKFIESKRKEKENEVRMEEKKVQTEKEEITDLSTITTLATVPVNLSEPQDTYTAPKVTAQDEKKRLERVTPVIRNIAPNKPLISLGFFKNMFRGKVPFYALTSISVLLVGLTIFVVLPVFAVYRTSKTGISNLEKTAESVKSLEFDKAKEQLTLASASFSKSKKSLKNLSWIFVVTGQRTKYISYYKTFTSLESFSNAGIDVVSGLSPLSNVWEILRPDTSEFLSSEDISNLNTSLSSASDKLGIAKAEYQKVKLEDFGDETKSEVLKYGRYLDSSIKYIDDLKLISSSLPDLVGMNKDSHYIVWFQNSNELRPTGGFIGSYGIFTLSKGKITNLTIDDIYNPDGQIDLRGIQTTPPTPIAEFLEEDNLYLRNSNWSPDFPESAKTFQDIYYKIYGYNFDGVAAIDLEFVKNLLDVTGPVFLAAYNEEITSQNLYERTQMHSDFNYEEGSTQKRSFLSVLGSKILEPLFNLDNTQVETLTGSLVKSFEERHIQFVFNNSPVNEILAENTLDGGLVKTEGDYLYVVNSNLGGTKSNYYVTTASDYKVVSMTRDGLLRGILTLKYKNTADSLAWPGGPYKDYVRVLTQYGSKLTGAKVIKSGEITDIFSSVVISSIGNYNSFETSFILNPQEEVTLQIEYDLSTYLSLSKDFKEYSLFWQKQPGVTTDTYSFSFEPPFGLEGESFTTGLEYTSGIFSSEGIMTTDKDYRVVLR